jgi:hypothetical protein
MSESQRALSPDLVDSVTVMIFCQTSKVRELLVDFLLAFGVDGMEPRCARFAPWLSFGACPVSFSPSKLCSSHIPRRPPGSCPDLTDADGRRRSTFICPQEWVEQVVKRVRGFDGGGSL